VREETTMSLRPRLDRLERHTGTQRQGVLIRAAVARLRALELPDGEERVAAAHRVIVEALDGLELSERVMAWDPELREAMSGVLRQLTIEELRALRGPSPGDGSSNPGAPEGGASPALTCK
jgi:hypothetical protein